MVVLALLAVPGLVALTRAVLPLGPLSGLALLVPGAVLVGAERLARPTGGPEIHDRQLDRILAALATVGAAMLVLGAWSAGGTTLAPMLVLSVGLLGTGIIVLLHGTRRLWQQKAAPLLLLAAWPPPWAALADRVVPHLGTGATTVAGFVLAALLVLLPLAASRRRAGRGHRPLGPDAPVGLPRRSAEAAVAAVAALGGGTARAARPSEPTRTAADLGRRAGVVVLTARPARAAS